MSWLNAKVNCTYQSLVFNVILIDYALIRYAHQVMGEGNKRITIESFVSISREHVFNIKVENAFSRLSRLINHILEKVYLFI